MANTPKRVAVFVATSGHSGVDRAMQHLLPELARRGFNVDLLHVRGHGPELTDAVPGLRIVELGASHAYTSFPALVRYLRRERPDALLADKDRVNRVALLGRALARVPTRLVLSIGTTVSVNLADRGLFERWLQRLSIGRLYPYADRVIVTSAGVADDMAAYTGLAPAHIEVVPSPVIPDALLTSRQPRPEHPWFADEGPPLILGLGELGSRKDYPTLLRAFARVRRRRPCRLMIIGRGKQRDRLLALAQQLAVTDDFALPGFIPAPYAYLAHADLFVFSSRWEGLGFVVIEALAVGTPVVSTDCPSGPREILQDGRFGALVPVGDDEAMADAIEGSLDQPPAPELIREGAVPYTVSHSADRYASVLGLISSQQASL